MRDSKGMTSMQAYCRVCGKLSASLILSENRTLKMVKIMCSEHGDSYLNQIKFDEPKFAKRIGVVEHHGY